jgi:hypothetical protein
MTTGWRRCAAGIVAVVLFAATAACSSDRAPVASRTTDATTRPGPTDAERIAALLPPAGDPADAAKVPEDCLANLDAMAGMGDMGSTGDAMPGQSEGGHDHGSTAPEGGDTTPVSTGRAPDGRYERTFAGINPRTEVSDVPFDAPATDEQRNAAAAFVAEVRAAVERHDWTDPVALAKAGYRPLQQCNSHWVSIEAVLDGRMLDPEHPEFVVVVAGNDGVERFESVMFLVNQPLEHGPQPFGSLAVWHFHQGRVCAIAKAFTLPRIDETCPSGSIEEDRSPEMLHVRLDGAPFRADM